MEQIRSYIGELKNTLDSLPIEDIVNISEILARAYKADKSVFIVGNGGSAATASHFACDLGKGTLERHYDMSKKKVQSLFFN